MALGIVLHAALAFFPSYWMVSDTRQNPEFGILFSAIHGFRMPLFFVMSGFFSAMLLHRRGRGSLVKHRFRRVFLPMLVGLFTLVPLTNAISNLALSTASRKASSDTPAEAKTGIWSAAQTGDLDAIVRYLASGVKVDDGDTQHGGAPLLWAAAAGQDQAVDLLIQRGADVNAVDPEGGSAILVAAFLGHVKIVDLLIQNGANVNAANKRGETPLDVAVIDPETTRYFASLLKLDLNEDKLVDRKAKITETLRQHGATPGRKPALTDLLMQMPLFNHLWFLWFLWWLVLGYAALSAFGSRLPSIPVPQSLVLSPARYLWLIPLTMIPQWFMGGGGGVPIFGPDTSAGLLPIPHVLVYYAIFFGFGALYYRYDDPSGRVGHLWWLPLAVGLFVLFPLSLALMAGWTGFPGMSLDPTARRFLTVAVQAAYPWLLTFGLMGLFRRICPAESPTMRYLSDSAYWLYLAHLPLIIAAQLLVRDWPLPAVAKFLLIIVVVTGVLLWTYHVMVRYTVIGRFLNGPRTRPTPVAEPAIVAG